MLEPTLKVPENISSELSLNTVQIISDRTSHVGSKPPQHSFKNTRQGENTDAYPRCCQVCSFGTSHSLTDRLSVLGEEHQKDKHTRTRTHAHTFKGRSYRLSCETCGEEDHCEGKSCRRGSFFVFPRNNECKSWLPEFEPSKQREKKKTLTCFCSCCCCYRCSRFYCY